MVTSRWSSVTEVTLITGLETVTVQVADLPLALLVAVTVAVPGATAVMLQKVPDALILAIFSSEVVHSRVLSTASSGLTTAETPCSFPTYRESFEKLSEMVLTLMTDGSTVTVQVPLTLGVDTLFAVIVVVPAFKAVTFPLLSTVATVLSEESQVSEGSKAFEGSTVLTMLPVSPELIRVISWPSRSTTSRSSTRMTALDCTSRQEPTSTQRQTAQ